MKQENIFCFDCETDLTDRTDFEPFIVGASMYEVFDRYRGRMSVTREILITQVSICFACLTVYDSIEQSDYFNGELQEHV